MADEQNQTSQTPPSTEAVAQPQGNSPEARNPDGSLKGNVSTALPNPSQTPETKPSTEAKPDAPTVPEKYEFKAPEGFELNADLIAKAEPIFKELGLTQDAAQKLIDFYGDAAKAAEEAPYAAYEDMRKGWRDSVVKDPVLGNGKDGLKPEVAATIGRAIDSLPAADAAAFREAMTMTGAGDNPAFIKAFHALASKLGEGTLVTGAGPSPAGQRPSGTRPSPAQAMYPNLPSSAR